MSILNMTITASLMILVTEILRRLTINRLPKSTFIALWAVITARLLIPFSLPFRFSAYTGIIMLASKITGKAYDGSAIIGTGSSSTEAAAGTASDEVLSGGYIHYTTILFIIWMIGILICAGYFIFTYVKNIRKFKESLPVSRALAENIPEEIKSQLPSFELIEKLNDNSITDEWRANLGIRRKVSVRESDYISSPLTYGFFRPVILLPKKMILTLDEEHLVYILTHELVHIKRLDAVGKLLLTSAVCVHWFNPFVWIMYMLANRDIELSCDEKVIQLLGSTSKPKYAMTLVRFAELRDTSPAVFNSFSKSVLTERVSAIMKKKVNTPVSMLAAGALFLVITSTLATSAYLTDGNVPEKYNTPDIYNKITASGTLNGDVSGISGNSAADSDAASKNNSTASGNSGTKRPGSSSPIRQQNVPNTVQPSGSVSQPSGGGNVSGGDSNTGSSTNNSSPGNLNNYGGNSGNVEIYEPDIDSGYTYDGSSSPSDLDSY